MHSEQAVLPFISAQKPERFVRLTTLARLTGIPDRTLRYLARTGKVCARRIGRRAWLLRAGDVDRIVADRATRVM